MENYYYYHVRHIMRQKSAKLGGIPFLTMPQGIAVLGTLGLANVLQLPLLVMGLLAVISYLSLYISQGEFIATRVIRVVKIAILIQLNQAPTTNITDAWKVLADEERAPARASVVYRTEGASMVSDMSGDEQKSKA